VTALDKLEEEPVVEEEEEEEEAREEMLALLHAEFFLQPFLKIDDSVTSWARELELKLLQTHHQPLEEQEEEEEVQEEEEAQEASWEEEVLDQLPHVASITTTMNKEEEEDEDVEEVAEEEEVVEEEEEEEVEKISPRKVLTWNWIPTGIKTQRPQNKDLTTTCQTTSNKTITLLLPLPQHNKSKLDSSRTFDAETLIKRTTPS